MARVTNDTRQGKSGTQCIVNLTPNIDFKVLAQEWAEPPYPRVNLVIPGPIASPQRAKTHPGEDRQTLPTPETLAVDLVQLLAPASRDIRGQLILWKDLGATL